MLDRINVKKILIPLNNNIYLNYDNIICLLEPKDIIDTNWFKSKKVIKAKDDIIDIKSYIYCKNNFIIATSIDVNSLKERIEKITFSYYNKNTF